nr:mucin-1-like [Aedes albopictus]
MPAISPPHCGSGSPPSTPPLANSTPANQVSTPNCGTGNPVSSPFGNTTPSWANDSLNGLANWIHSVDTPDKPPTNLDTDSDCIMIEETTTKPKTTESKEEKSGSSATVHRPVQSKPEPETESKPIIGPKDFKSLFLDTSMLMAIYEKPEKPSLPKPSKDRLSLKKRIPMRLASEDQIGNDNGSPGPSSVADPDRHTNNPEVTPNPVSQPGRRNATLLSSEESTPKPVRQPGRRNAMLLSSEDESTPKPLSVQRSAHKQPGNDAQPGQPAGPSKLPLSVQRPLPMFCHIV